MVAGRTLHVRCTTWQQVEIFYTRKLRRGKLLSMKVPFRADVGTPVSLGLELPNQVVITIEGRVQKAAPMESDPGKTWIEIELEGFNDAVIARIKAMMAGGAPAGDPAAPAAAAPASASAQVTAPAGASFAAPADDAGGDGSSRVVRRPTQPPPPVGEPLPADERQLFMHLTGELRRLRQLAVHEVLGVDRDADADAIRLGWMRLVRRHHPDLVARYHAPAIMHLAEELTILCNRAYDRLRAALVLEGRATAIGSVLQQPAGWLVGFDDISSRSASSSRVAIMTDADHDALVQDASEELIEAIEPPQFMFEPGLGGGGSGPTSASQGAAQGAAQSAAQGDESFENRARMMLSNGDADHAQEVLAAALCVYPRSRPLRSLYYVASALEALRKGERMLATSQLETALAHYEHCAEAAQILDYMKKHAHASHEELRRFFR
jgi:hypothetical protein